MCISGSVACMLENVAYIGKRCVYEIEKRIKTLMIDEACVRERGEIIYRYCRAIFKYFFMRFMSGAWCV